MSGTLLVLGTGSLRRRQRRRGRDSSFSFGICLSKEQKINIPNKKKPTFFQSKKYKNKKKPAPLFFNQLWIDFKTLNAFLLEKGRAGLFSFFGLVSVQRVGFIFSDNYLDSQKCLISPRKLGFQKPVFLAKKTGFRRQPERELAGELRRSLMPVKVFLNRDIWDFFDPLIFWN